MSKKRISIDEMYRSDDDGSASDFIGQTREVDGKLYRVIDAQQVWGDGEDEGFTLELEAL